MHAIVRRPSPTLAIACELTHLARTPIDFPRLEAQHARYVAILRALGCSIDVLPALANHPDSVFVEDAALVLDELAILTRPGTPGRRDEPAHLRCALQALGLRVVTLEEPATLDGGDVLRIGRRLYVGQGTRTNAEGMAQLTALVAPLRFDVVAVPLGPCLHLKTAVTALDDETLLANPDWVDTTHFGERRVLEVHPAERFAANVLRLGTALVVNAAYPATQRIIESHARACGLSVHSVDIAEFGKAEAGLSCLSIVASAKQRGP